MKKYLIILLWLASISLNAATYYVATTGSDAASGDITHPWLTWSHAFANAHAGDFVYFRGGSYPNSGGAAGEGGFNSGTAGNVISFLNYPGETPILDCSNKTVGVAGWFRAISVWNVSYLYFKGLTIANAHQLLYGGVYGYTTGMDAYKANHITFEQIKVHDVEGPCFTINGCDDVHVINCDAWNANDLHAGTPGQNGVGFQGQNTVGDFGSGEYAKSNYFTGCRTWGFSDNGFAFTGVSHVEWKNCWALDGGLLAGDGCGFKLGTRTSGDTINPLSRLVENCISAYNEQYGFATNNGSLGGGTGTPFNCHFYNNFAYHNGYKTKTDLSYGYGFVISPYNVNYLPPHEMYSNNIAYDNMRAPLDLGGGYVHTHNSWDIVGLNVTNADFISLDTTGMRGARKTDGSLPDTYFGKPASASSLIDKGIDVGLPFSGTAPDLGYSEYEAQIPPVTGIVIITTTVFVGSTQATCGGDVTDDGGSAITARGVCWGFTANPTVMGNHTSNGTGSGVFAAYLTGLTPSTTYHVRAYAVNEAGTGYGADVAFTTRSSGGLAGSYLFTGGKAVFVLDKTDNKQKIIMTK